MAAHSTNPRPCRRVISMKFRLLAPVLALIFLSSYIVGQQKPATVFPPLEQWKTTVVAGNPTALKALYSSSPAPQIATPAGQTTADADISFWSGLKARSIKLNVLQSTSPQPGLQQVVFEAEVKGTPH